MHMFIFQRKHYLTHCLASYYKYMQNVVNYLQRMLVDDHVSAFLLYKHTNYRCVAFTKRDKCIYILYCVYVLCIRPIK